MRSPVDIPTVVRTLPWRRMIDDDVGHACTLPRTWLFSCVFYVRNSPCTDESACFPCVLHSEHSQPSRDPVLLCCRVYTAPARGALRFPSYRPRSFGRFNHRFCISALACICERASFVRAKVAAGHRSSSSRDWYRSSVLGRTERTWNSRFVECSLLSIQIYASFCYICLILRPIRSLCLFRTCCTISLDVTLKGMNFWNRLLRYIIRVKCSLPSLFKFIHCCAISVWCYIKFNCFTCNVIVT